MHHHGDRLVCVKIFFAVQSCKPQQCMLCFLRFAFSHQPPWRLGSKIDADEKRQRPYPLQSIRDAICPFIVAVQHGLDDSDSDFLAKSPTKVDIRRQIPAQRDWADFRSVSDGKRLEDPPRDAAQNLGHQQSLDVGRSEEDCGEGSNENETDHDGVSVTKSFRDKSVDKEANNFTDNRALMFFQSQSPRSAARGLPAFHPDMKRITARQARRDALGSKLTLLKPACQGAGTSYVPVFGWYSPYLRVNGGNASGIYNISGRLSGKDLAASGEACHLKLAGLTKIVHKTDIVPFHNNAS